MVAPMPAPLSSQTPSSGTAALTQADRSFGLGGLQVAAEDGRIASATMARSQHQAYLHLASSPAFSARSGRPEQQAKAAYVAAFPWPNAGHRRTHAFQRSAALGQDGEVAIMQQIGTLQVKGSLMPGGITSPILAKEPAPGVIGQGGTARMTSAAMVFTPVHQRSPGAPSPTGRGASASLAGMHPLLVDRSTGPGANGLSADEAREDDGSPFVAGLHDVLPTETPRNFLPVTMVLRRQIAAVRSIRPAFEGAQGLLALSLILARAGSPVPYAPTASALIPGPEAPGGVDQPSNAAGRAHPHDSEADADDIVERAWREVMSRLAIEKERRGFGRWS
jgi:hypothetical protein